MEVCLIMSTFAYMMIYFIEFNELIMIKVCLWKFLFNEPNEDESQSEPTETHNYKIQNKKRTANKYSIKHNLQRKRQEPVDYRNNSFYDFRLMIVDPHPKLDSD